MCNVVGYGFEGLLDVDGDGFAHARPWVGEDEIVLEEVGQHGRSRGEESGLVEEEGLDGAQFVERAGMDDHGKGRGDAGAEQVEGAVVAIAEEPSAAELGGLEEGGCRR